ncbi:MAG: DtxR family transcriptional regulator Mn-dependent transcriptional regulator [Bacteroidetes bacterium]|nr:MAG: DtxR family transcriptional regulator Mn-dependent transcriptional regulator [Bacteroidota bacterium]
MSSATENFVKVIYQFNQNQGLDTKPGTVAKALGISNAAATDMAKKLARKELVVFQKYRPLQLTENGKRMALNVIRKHRLWETFLYRTLKLSLHEIHREAELLEHLTSDFLTERLSIFLGSPDVDPHGDPIPDIDGHLLSDQDQITLLSAEAGSEYKIVRLAGSDSEFFEFCEDNNITVGAQITVGKQYAKNKMTRILINDQKLLLNAVITNKIFVEQK